MSTEQSTEDRLKRIEARVVTGFKSMGVDVTKTSARIYIDNEGGTIDLGSMGVTVSDVLAALARNGESKHYDMVHNGRYICSINNLNEVQHD